MENYEAIASLVDYVDGRLICKRTGNYRDTTIQSSGYAACKGTVGGIVYRSLAHRVIWYIHHGLIPKGKEIDHIDRNKLNNDITNLRLVTRSQNCHNMDTSGVYLDKRNNSWYSCISHNGKQRRIGTFDSPEQARAAYLKAKSIILNNIERL